MYCCHKTYLVIGAVYLLGFDLLALSAEINGEGGVKAENRLNRIFIKEEFGDSPNGNRDMTITQTPQIKDGQVQPSFRFSDFKQIIKDINKNKSELGKLWEEYITRKAFGGVHKFSKIKLQSIAEDDEDIAWLPKNPGLSAVKGEIEKEK